MNYYYITGTSRGIGRALAENILNNENNFIYGISRSEAIAHSNFEQITLDLANIEEVRNFTFHQHKDAESIILINNAGILGKIRQVGRFELKEITMGFNVNSIAPAILMNKFISTFQDQRCKKIILNIGSSAGRNPQPSWSNYCSSKAALDMYARVIAEEQKDHDPAKRINVFSLAPGFVETNMQKMIRKTRHKDFRNVGDFISYKEFGILSKPQEVAEHILSIINNCNEHTKVLLDIRKIEKKNQ